MVLAWTEPHVPCIAAALDWPAKSCGVYICKNRPVHFRPQPKCSEALTYLLIFIAGRIHRQLGVSQRQRTPWTC